MTREHLRNPAQNPFVSSTVSSTHRVEKSWVTTANVEDLELLSLRQGIHRGPNLGVPLLAAYALISSMVSAGEPLNLSVDQVEARLLKDVEYLASDELEGRGVHTRGLDLAAEYIASDFRRSGLNASHYEGTPFQEFPVTSGHSVGSLQSLTLYWGENASELQPELEFRSLQEIRGGSYDLPVTFVGYGITAPQFDYDDYAGLDVRGHAVIVLRQEPQSRDPLSRFAGTEPTEHAYVRSKIRNAVGRGAKMVLLCTEGASLKPADTSELPITDELLDVSLRSEPGIEAVPVLHVRRDIIETWIHRAEHVDLSELEQEIDTTMVPRSRRLSGARITGRVVLNRPTRTLRNVIATLDTQGPHSQEAIVVGAHYDHLGRGGWGSLALDANGVIHNGADDNASGVAVLLEVARQLAAAEKPLRRRVILIAFTGEEQGLFGSKRYIQQPLVPLNQTIAMLNLDMVGRLREDRLTVYGVGTSREWPEMVNDAAVGPALKVIGYPSGFGPSDHAPFHERGVPVLHFFTGFHPEYHRPPDDVQLLNIGGMRRTTDLVLNLIRSLDERDQPLTPTPGEPLHLENGELASLLIPATMAPLPRLGVVLDSNLPEPGLIVRRVLPQSLAERNGILPSDILIKMNGIPLASREDFVRLWNEVDAAKTMLVDLDRGGVVRQLELKR